MPYIGTSPSNGVRRVHTYTGTASQTTFSGASSEGVTLSYVDTNYIDVFQNGVLLGSADYTSTSGTSVVLAQGASADDLIVIVVYDVFSVADTVSKTNGGTFDNGITIDESGATVLTVDRATSDGSIIDLQKDGTGVGSIGVGNTLRPYIGSGDTGIMFDASNNAIYPWNTSTNNVPASDQVDLGYNATGLKFKDLYLSGGVYLGGTGSANYLDDYEEGTWTAEVRGATTRATTPVTGQAHYTKVGNKVTVRMYFVNANTTGASGVFQITGFPFSATSLQIIPFMSFGQDYDDSGGVMNVQLYLEGGTTAQLIATKDNSAWQTTGITAGSGKYYAFTGTYLTS